MSLEQTPRWKFHFFVSVQYLACHITCSLHDVQDASFQFIAVQSTVHIPNTAKRADAHSDVSQKLEL